MLRRPIFLLEAEGYTAVSTSTINRIAMRGREGYRTLPTDTPPNTAYLDRAMAVGLLSQSMFEGGLTSSRLQPSGALGAGGAILANPDGALDSTFGRPHVINFRERPARVLMLEQGAAYSTAQVVQRTVVSQIKLEIDQVTIFQKDLLYTLDTPHLTTTYLGNNVLPNGVEGDATLAGKFKPQLLGTKYQFEPILVNTSRLIYQVSISAVQTITAYDGGAGLTAGADYVSQVDMETTAPAAGQYRVWKAGGMFRLASKPVYRLVVDAVGDTSPNSTAAQLLKRLAIAKGYSAGDVSASDVTALDTANSAVLGEWINDGRTTKDIMDAIAGTVGAYYNFDRLSVLRMARLELPPTPIPANAPVLAPWNIGSVETVTSDEDIPTTKVRIRYAHYSTTQSGSDVAGAVTAVIAADIAQEWRVAESTSTPAPNPYKRTQTLERDTLFAFKADADTEAARLGVLFGTPRATHILRDVELNSDTLLALDLNAIVELRWNRYGFSTETGVTRRVIAIPSKDITAGKVDLTVWGTIP